MLEFLPVSDVSDAVATAVNADVATTWDALMEVDLGDSARRVAALVHFIMQRKQLLAIARRAESTPAAGLRPGPLGNGGGA